MFLTNLAPKLDLKKISKVNEKKDILGHEMRADTQIKNKKKKRRGRGGKCTQTEVPWDASAATFKMPLQ